MPLHPRRSRAKAAGAAIGSSRPVAETLKYLPLTALHLKLQHRHQHFLR